MELGNNIRRLRFENNEMSQEELAASVGVTRQTIHAVEKGKFVPSALLAFKIARFFQVNVEDVFYLTGNDEKV
jgi:putative transcriptional regulator